MWLKQPGVGSGEGGSGHRRSEPAQQVQVRGADLSSVPPASRIAMSEVMAQEPAFMLDAPILALADSDFMRAGVLEGLPDSLSRGPGDGGGAGEGKGPGIGPGDGDGLGNGRGPGIGDGVYGIGNGVTAPVALHREKPQYTVEAMRARVEGAVVIECVVQPSGACSNARVLRSLDARFGLDQQALRAAALWRFAPGRRLGQPVPVLVTIQLAFSIN